jgi:hypothetical protein
LLDPVSSRTVSAMAERDEAELGRGLHGVGAAELETLLPSVLASSSSSLRRPSWLLRAVFIAVPAACALAYALLLPHIREPARSGKSSLSLFCIAAGAPRELLGEPTDASAHCPAGAQLLVSVPPGDAGARIADVHVVDASGATHLAPFIDQAGAAHPFGRDASVIVPPDGILPSTIALDPAWPAGPLRVVVDENGERSRTIALESATRSLHR